MPRISRVVLPGVPHHITQRGVRSLPVFYSDRERKAYLCLLARQGKRFQVRFVSYCLMTNHVHLIAVPGRPESLARAIGEAHRRYTCWQNGRSSSKGYFFQGRFFSCPLDERHLLAAVRYVERNPVRARMVRQAWEYPWSSAAYHAGLREGDPLIEGRPLGGVIDDWKEFLALDPPEIQDLRKSVKTGRPLGDEGFVQWAERMAGRPLAARPVGRPRKVRK